MARESGRAEDIEGDNTGEGTEVRERLKDPNEVSWHPEQQSASSATYYLKDIAQSLRILIEGFGYPRKTMSQHDPTWVEDYEDEHLP